MGTNVRPYTDKEILARVKSLKSCHAIPIGYWIVGIRSKEDASDQFDDKFYLFQGDKFVMCTTGTTNPGKYGLTSFMDYNKAGCAVVKADEFYHNIWKYGLHKGKMEALVQVSPILYFRDNNKNLKSEEIGEVKTGIIGINFHTATYEKDANKLKKFIAWAIGKWSEGCQVCDHAFDYYRIIELVKKQIFVSYCLLNEF